MENLRQTQIDLTLREMGDRICQRMYEKRWTLKFLAQQANVNRITLYKIFKGESYNVTSLISVLLALDMNIKETMK